MERFREALAHARHGWPDDDEFREAVATYPLFFRSHPDQRKLILEALEESYPHRQPAGYERLEIEFLAPLLPTPEWLAETGADEQRYWRLVGTLGNLTWNLRGQSLSLGVPARKKELRQTGRFGLQLNRELAESERWTAEVIEERSRRLAERAVKLWPGPGNRGT
jgi:hypothetical protein